MHIWYVSLYEPLPVGGEGIRPMRSGLLANALVSDGHDVELWLPGFEHVHHEQFRNESVIEKINDRLCIQYMSGPGYQKDTSYKRLFHNRKIAKEFKKLSNSRLKLPDLILTQVPSLELAEAVMVFSKKKSIPYVVDVRDPWPEIYKRLLPDKIKFLYKILFFTEIRRAKRIFSNAFQITAVSLTYLNSSLIYSNRARNDDDVVFPIGYPVETNIIKNRCELEKKYESFRNKFIVFFAGTLGSNFDIMTVIKASERLDSDDNNIHFVIAGKGGGMELLLAHEKKSNNFTFLGWVPLSELRYLLEISSVGLAPFPEGALNSLPNKPYEYMSASLPIISSLDGELKEMISDNGIGFYYKAGDSNGLVKAIFKLFSNHDVLNKMSAMSHKLLVDKYNAKFIYPKFSKYLVSILTKWRH
jgi:glycosyltransferase involved in cell wall biosynthesis